MFYYYLRYLTTSEKTYRKFNKFDLATFFNCTLVGLGCLSVRNRYVDRSDAWNLFVEYDGANETWRAMLWYEIKDK